MSRKKHSITLAFLDLLFALFAALTMLNIMLAITKGRTAHTLEKDFMVVQVLWKEDARQSGFRDDVELYGTAGDRPVCWTHRQPPIFDDDDAPLESAYVVGPLPPGTWRLTGRMELIDEVRVTTRRGTITHRPSDEFILLTTS